MGDRGGGPPNAIVSSTCNALHNISAISAGSGAMVDPFETRERLEWALRIVPPFRPIRQTTVMCTVQGCPHFGAFVFIGGIDCATGWRSSAAAYCDRHAEGAAAGLGQLRPRLRSASDRAPPDRLIHCSA